MLNNMIPKEIFFTRGVGRHKEKLASFEEALRNAKIAQYNLVRVSSIFPPHVNKLSRDTGLMRLNDGQIVFCVMADYSTNEVGRRVTASIGVAIPKDRTKYGYLSEHHCFGMSAKDTGEYAEDLAAGMLATTLGIPFDADKNYNEKKEQYLFGNLIVATNNITQTAIGKKGCWTTCLACAVFIL